VTSSASRMATRDRVIASAEAASRFRRASVVELKADDLQRRAAYAGSLIRVVRVRL